MLVISQTVQASQVDIGFKVGGYWGRGDYGKSEDTDINMIPVALSVRQGRWQCAISGGWIRFDGPSGGTGGEGSTPERRTDSGLADTFITVKYRFPRWGDLPLFLDADWKLKLPTADEEKGLGTGKADVALRGGVFWWRQGLSPYGRVGYRFRGQPDNATEELDDTLSLVIGGRYPLNKDWDLMLQIQAQEAVRASSEARVELGLFSRWKLGKAERLTGYAVQGQTSASPEIALGFQYEFLL